MIADDRQGAEKKVRGRGLGIPFDGTPGQWNAITDVAGVTVGHVTLIRGEGKRIVGEGPVRTGVTAILPRGEGTNAPVFAGWFSLNGNGEMTGTAWIDESGFLEGPVLITNTHSVGVVRDAAAKWMVNNLGTTWALPVVTETYDGYLNDINGHHVKEKHANEALTKAVGGPVAEGNVGGGTAMRCHDFKGGIGTSSRVLSAEAGGHTVGVLVQSNYGKRHQLRIAGVPVGEEITDLRSTEGTDVEKSKSIVILVATDAPLLPHQLNRIAKRAAMGLARVGSVAETTSGDIFLAFSTANPNAYDLNEVTRLEMFPNNRMSPLFEATAQATEEAIVNSMIAAETMTGADGNTTYALPHDRLQQVLRKYNRLNEI